MPDVQRMRLLSHYKNNISRNGVWTLEGKHKLNQYVLFFVFLGVASDIYSKLFYNIVTITALLNWTEIGAVWWFLIFT